MTIVTMDSLSDIEMISQDAYRLGTIQDIRYDSTQWNIEGFKVKSNKGASILLGAGSSRSMLIIKPYKFVLNDVLLLPDDAAEVKNYSKADTDSIPALSSLLGKRIITSDGITLGFIENILIDLDNWFVHSFRVKLDKSAYEALSLKKGLFSKTISGILTTSVSAVSDNIMLRVSANTLKDMITLD
ncbi:MAG: hypothetical protein IJF47_01670 [Candidatus Methanomethylophilaceae archaeon]|nr:hypothetical protein [Thermoplasmata archaeon]MBQ2762404.1 hypothetical protein [Candidatus Methanomethylophilaceae archaeon]